MTEKMKEFVCEVCSKKFKAEESLKQHKEMSHRKGIEVKVNKSKKKYFLLIGFVLAIVFVVSGFYIRSQKPGLYDEFAKCLAEKNVIIYGNDFCQYTGRQLNDFGKSEKFLNYVKCAENKELCDNKGVKITPTWEIEGKMHEGVQSFETLSGLTGCTI